MYIYVYSLIEGIGVVLFFFVW